MRERSKGRVLYLDVMMSLMSDAERIMNPHL